ncbi:MAG: hypothetical protein VW931_08980 [Alphaproteobacteria bacterium]
MTDIRLDRLRDEFAFERDEILCAPVKQIIARARAAEVMPWVVSGES